MSIEIQVETENGSAFGYVASTREPNFLNYLREHTEHAKTIADMIKGRFGNVALLRNMHVDEEARGCGEGTELVMRFLSEAAALGAEMVMLVSDAEEEQLPDFDLVSFYEGFDFSSSVMTSSGLLMFSDEEFAEQVKNTAVTLDVEKGPSLSYQRNK